VSVDARSPRALAARLLSLLDLTSLSEDDTSAQIEALCRSAVAAPRLPAAVCVYPEHITTARHCLQGTEVKVATVVNFPDGGSDPTRVERETRRALAAGSMRTYRGQELPHGLHGRRAAETSGLRHGALASCHPRHPRRLLEFPA
jgi:dienelactone hydrolase